MVLACMDLSDNSPVVLDTAAVLARALDAPLWLLHVAAEEPELVGYDVDPIGAFTAEDRAHRLLEEHTELRDRANELTREGLTVRPLLAMGPTVETVLAEADRLDVGWIVVGTHGKGPLATLLLGSTSEGLLRRSTRPVVIVPPDDRKKD